MAAKYHYEYAWYEDRNGQVTHKPFSIASDEPPEKVLPRIDHRATELTVWQPDEAGKASGVHYKRAKGKPDWTKA